MSVELLCFAEDDAPFAALRARYSTSVAPCARATGLTAPDLPLPLCELPAELRRVGDAPALLLVFAHGPEPGTPPYRLNLGRHDGCAFSHGIAPLLAEKLVYLVACNSRRVADRWVNPWCRLALAFDEYLYLGDPRAAPPLAEFLLDPLERFLEGHLAFNRIPDALAERCTAISPGDLLADHARHAAGAIRTIPPRQPVALYRDDWLGEPARCVAR